MLGLIVSILQGLLLRVKFVTSLGTGCLVDGTKRYEGISPECSDIFSTPLQDTIGVGKLCCLTADCKSHVV